MAELVDAHDSNSCSFGSEGSIPSFGTKTFQISGRFFCIPLGAQVRPKRRTVPPLDFLLVDRNSKLNN